jgi:hypothetical protein
VLEFQEQALAGEMARLERALMLVRKARAKLKAGNAFSVDDLATLTTETTMTTSMTHEDMKEIIQPLIAKHFPPDQVAEVSRRFAAQAKFGAERKALIEEGKDLMAKDDAVSPAALDWGRRWVALGSALHQGDAEFAIRAMHVWREAWANPNLAAKNPVGPKFHDFLPGVMLALLNKYVGEDAGAHAYMEKVGAPLPRQ